MKTIARGSGMIIFIIGRGVINQRTSINVIFLNVG